MIRSCLAVRHRLNAELSISAFAYEFQVCDTSVRHATWLHSEPWLWFRSWFPLLSNYRSSTWRESSEQQLSKVHDSYCLNWVTTSLHTPFVGSRQNWIPVSLLICQVSVSSRSTCFNGPCNILSSYPKVQQKHGPDHLLAIKFTGININQFRYARKDNNSLTGGNCSHCIARMVRDNTVLTALLNNPTRNRRRVDITALSWARLQQWCYRRCVRWFIDRWWFILRHLHGW